MEGIGQVCILSICGFEGVGTASLGCIWDPGHCGTHPGVPMCAAKTPTTTCMENPLWDKTNTRSPGTGSGKVPGLPRLPQTFAFYQLRLTSPPTSCKLMTPNRLQYLNSAQLQKRTEPGGTAKPGADRTAELPRHRKLILWQAASWALSSAVPG